MLRPNDSSKASHGEASPTVSLQPMGFTDILDAIFSLYRNHFRLFLGISAVYFFSHIVSSTFTHWVIDFCEPIVLVLCYGWLTFASAQAYLGKHVTARAALKRVKNRFWSYIGSVLLWCLVVGAPVIFIFVVPSIIPIIGVLGVSAMIIGVSAIIIAGFLFAIYFATRWAFCIQAVMVEETSATKAFRRSSELVKGAWWRVFGIMFAILLIYLIIDLILIASATLIFALLGIAREVDLLEIIRRTIWGPHGYIEGILHLLHAIQTAIDALTMPITAIGYTLLYYDLRIRKEGFDIEMMLAKEEV